MWPPVFSSPYPLRSRGHYEKGQCWVQIAVGTVFVTEDVQSLPRPDRLGFYHLRVDFCQ